MRRLMLQPINTRQAGITLIELIVVMLLLSVLAIGTSSYLRIGTTMYVDAAARDRALQQGRFALERVSRELRLAAPASVRVGVSNDLTAECVEFVPIAQSGVYSDLPLFPLRRNWLALLTIDTSWQGVSGQRLTVYPTDPSHIYQLSQLRTAVLDVQDLDDGDGNANTHRVKLQNISGQVATFAADSPQQRFYLLHTPVSFCKIGNQLYRYSDYGFAASQPLPPASAPALLAVGLQNQAGEAAFRYDAAVLTRSAVLHIFWRFSVAAAADQDLFFNQEVHFPNVP